MTNYGLKPCPFCGSKNVRLTTKKATVHSCFAEEYQGKLRVVVCCNCGCNGGIFNTLAVSDNEARKQAIKSWNRRAEHIDAQPIIHARWEQKETVLYVPLGKCSNCGSKTVRGNFCRVCGAKMDEEGEK